MKIERSNFSPSRELRAIPDSCPKELRTKIEAARQTTTRKAASVETQSQALIKEFAANLEQ
jgi:hypothetical protein